MQPLSDSSFEPLNYIPEELWVETFSYLTPRDICQVSLVSKLFKAIAQDFWKEAIKRSYPDTYAQLIERHNVQKIEGGKKKRKLDSSEEINWKKQASECVRFFSAVKKGQLQSKTLLKDVNYFEIFDGRIYAFEENQFNSTQTMTTTLVNDQLVATKVNYLFSGPKAVKEGDGSIYFYTGTMFGDVISWKFCETHFERQMNLQGQRHATRVRVIETLEDHLISMDSHEVCVWKKQTGTNVKRLPCKREYGRYTSLAIGNGRILAGTAFGVIKIWDDSSLLLVDLIANGKCSINSIQVHNDKIFYASQQKIYAVDFNRQIDKDNF